MSVIILSADEIKRNYGATLYIHQQLHAINLNAQITFKYFSYDAKKQKQYMRKGELYTASPWTMIYADDNYYLLAYEKGTFKHFRVDKMDNVTPCVETFELTGEEVVTLPREGKEEFERWTCLLILNTRSLCMAERFRM